MRRLVAQTIGTSERLRLPAAREPLGGSPEPPQVMTRKRVRESHRVDFLMLKNEAFRKSSTMTANINKKRSDGWEARVNNSTLINHKSEKKM